MGRTIDDEVFKLRASVKKARHGMATGIANQFGSVSSIGHVSEKRKELGIPIVREIDAFLDLTKLKAWETSIANNEKHLIEHLETERAGRSEEDRRQGQYVKPERWRTAGHEAKSKSRMEQGAQPTHAGYQGQQEQYFAQSSNTQLSQPGYGDAAAGYKAPAGSGHPVPIQEAQRVHEHGGDFYPVEELYGLGNEYQGGTGENPGGNELQPEGDNTSNVQQTQWGQGQGSQTYEHAGRQVNSPQ